MKKFNEMCKRYNPFANRGVILDAATGAPIQNVVSRNATGFRYLLGMFCILFAFALAFQAMTGVALATDDDITTTIASLGGYWTAIKVTALAILLFVLGRRIVRKV